MFLSDGREFTLEYSKTMSGDESVLEVFSDADWASDRDTRRSVSGAAIFFGGCLVYSSGRTQKSVSLSSAESETYAAASAVMDAITHQSHHFMDASVNNSHVFVH